MLDQITFQTEIESLVQEKRLSYMDAILSFCSDNELEPEDIKSVMSPYLTDMLYQSAQEEGFMLKTARLPL